MAAEVFGIDNLKSYIETYKNITNVHIYAFSNSKKSVASAICSRDNGDLLEQVETYLNLSASGENSTKTYYILLKAENKNKEVDVVGFTFSMESKTASLAVNGTSNQAPAENNRINDLYYQLGDMQRHNNQLQAENQELKQELAILQENAEISGIEDPLEKYMPYIAPMLSKLFGLENTPVNGVNSDIELSNIIAELQNIDPDFKNNMFLLLKLAKNKPMIYKMAVKQLTSL